MKRNMLIVLFVMMLPVIQCCLMYYTFGGEPKDVQIITYNDEYKYCSSLKTNFTGCNTKYLSCAFTDYLIDKGLDLITTEDREVLSNIYSTKAWARMYFPVNFSGNLLERLQGGRSARDDAINNGEVKFWTDNSDYVVNIVTKKNVLESFSDFLRNLYFQCDWPVKLADIPIRFEKPIFGNEKLNFPHSSIPPVIVMIGFYLPMAFTLVSVLSERIYGQWDRTMVSGTSIWEIIIAHIILQSCTWSIQTVTMLCLEFGFFQCPMEGSIFLTVMLLLITAFSGMFLGLLIAFTHNSFSEASSSVLGFYFITIFLGGTLWPVEGMHKYIRELYYVIPLALPSEALRAIAYKAWPITHPTVYLGFVSSFVYAVVFITLTALVLKLQKIGYVRK